MHIPFYIKAKAPRYPTLLILLAGLAVLLALGCNPFGGGEADTPETSEEVVEASFDRTSAENSQNNQQSATTQPTEQPTIETSDQNGEGIGGAAPELPASDSPQSPTIMDEQPAGSSSPDAGAEEAVSRVWAFLSQCVSLGINDLEAQQIGGEWFVQSAGEDPDRYGIWKVDPATGSVRPHNIRARQWEPQFKSTCTKEAFAEFYNSTSSPRSASAVTEPGQAVTSIWATLVKCYPAMSAEDLQATLNPAQAEWIVTARPEVTTNYGVWTVGSNGEILPYNRQAQGIYGQLDSGLC